MNIVFLLKLPQINFDFLLRNGLFDEYQEIKSQPPDGTFDNARLAQNQAKVGPLNIIQIIIVGFSREVRMRRCLCEEVFTRA